MQGQCGAVVSVGFVEAAGVHQGIAKQDQGGQKILRQRVGLLQRLDRRFRLAPQLRPRLNQGIGAFGASAQACRQLANAASMSPQACCTLPRSECASA